MLVGTATAFDGARASLRAADSRPFWLATVPGTVPARSAETLQFPEHFVEGGFRKTAAFETIESRSRQCRLRV